MALGYRVQHTVLCGAFEAGVTDDGNPHGKLVQYKRVGRYPPPERAPRQVAACFPRTHACHRPSKPGSVLEIGSVGRNSHRCDCRPAHEFSSNGQYRIVKCVNIKWITAEELRIVLEAFEGLGK